MSLQGAPLWVLLFIINAGAIAATVVLWQRLAGRGPLRVLARIGMIVLCQLTVVLLLAVSANNYFYLYGTWADVFGGPSNVDIISGSQPVPGPLVGGYDGRMTEVALQGSTTGLTGRGFVYLPPQYHDPRYANTRFPVLVMLTGYPGEALSLVRRLEVPSRLQTENAAGRMQPMIVVMLASALTPPRNTECIDVPGGPQTGTYFTRDLVDIVTTQYRALSPPHSWTIMGVSTGGYCAVKLSMMHPRVYSQAVSLSGHYHAITGQMTGDLYRDAHTKALNDPLWRLAHLPAPPISVLVTASQTDPSVYKETKKFVDSVKAPMAVSHAMLATGGHSFETWAAELPAVLDWIGQHTVQPSSHPVKAPKTPVSPDSVKIVLKHTGTGRTASRASKP